MNLIKRNFFISLAILIFLLSLITDWYEGLAVLLLLATVATILDKLGKGIVLRELIVLHAVFVCLIMPIFGYEVYNEHNHLAKLFQKYMHVPKDRYFGFVLPALSAFTIAICWPITKKKKTLDEGAAFQHLLKEIKFTLKRNYSGGPFLLAVGVVMFYVAAILPIELRFVASAVLAGMLLGGVLHVSYSPLFSL